MKTHKLTIEENDGVSALRGAIEFADGGTDTVFGETRERVIVLAGETIQQHNALPAQPEVLGLR